MKDSILASDVIYARENLLDSAELRQVLAELSDERVGAWSESGTAHDRLGYCLKVSEVARSTGGLFTDFYIDRYASEWAETERRLDQGWGGVIAGIGFTCGRSGRGRRMTQQPIELAVRSIALQVAGSRPSEADEKTSDEWNAGRPLRFQTMTPTVVGVYRKRIRDRALGL